MTAINLNYNDIAFDTQEIPQEELNIENKVRSNILKWNGQFSPQFIEVLLNRYCQENFKVLDPFAGSGTVLYESSLRGIEALGIEVNPAAYHLSKIYEWINISNERREELISILEERIVREIVDINISKEEMENVVLNILNSLDDSYLHELITVFIVLLDFFNNVDYNIFFKRWNHLKNIVTQLPYSDKSIRVLNADARSIPLGNDTFDLVITSPPYINVFNYHQQYRESMELLGYNLLKVAKSEIGSNRKHRINRFLTVIQYCIDIALTLKELSRVCKDNSRIIFIVGRESNVRKVSFSNSKLVYLVARECIGMNLILKQERVFKNRYGQMIYEDILHFENTKLCNKSESEIIRTAKEIANNELSEAIHKASGDVLEDIHSAIEKLNDVNCSVFYSREER